MQARCPKQMSNAAWGRELVGKYMGLGKEDLSAMRRSVTSAIGINGSSTEGYIMIQMVRLIGCGMTIEETQHVAAEIREKNKKKYAVQHARRKRKKAEGARRSVEDAKPQPDGLPTTHVRSVRLAIDDGLKVEL